MLSSLAGNYGFDGPAVVLPNGRSAKAFAPGEKQPFIFSAGRLWDEAKNLAALEAVAPRLPWPVCVAGSSAHPDGGLRQPRNVCALGELPPEALAAQFARASIYALPARYEPFGQTALEAALSGCALVLGDIESLREVWGESALYVPPDDHEVLQSTLLRLIGEPALRVRLGRRAIARAGRFAPERMAEAYLRSYRRLLARGHGPVEIAAAMEAACAS
jgi:glycosyltransferase involved in cell wall biosynthesis